MNWGWPNFPTLSKMEEALVQGWGGGADWRQSLEVINQAPRLEKGVGNQAPMLPYDHSSLCGQVGSPSAQHCCALRRACLFIAACQRVSAVAH